MKQLGCILFLLCFNFSAFAKRYDNRFFRNADQFFRKYAWDGKVDYLKVSENAWQLDELVRQIARFKIDASRTERTKSFYINAYNVLVIKNVVAHYPVSSVKEVDGFFDNVKFNVAGKKLSLNQIQFNKLMKIDNDERILFALSAGSTGNPKIYNTALSYRPQLNINLENRVKSLVNDDFYIHVNDEQQTVTVSQLFLWYAKEITANTIDELSFINNYRQKKIPKGYSILYNDFDWSLNDWNENTVLTYAAIQKVNLIHPVVLKIDESEKFSVSFKENLVMRDSEIISINYKNSHNYFDEELGFRNESRFMENKTYELRITDKFYTQQDFYNKQMLRVTNDHRTTYNSFTMQGTYAFSRKLQGGLWYNTYKLYNDYSSGTTTDFFSTSNDKKFQVSELQFFGKYKWGEKKYRFSTLAYISLPLVNKRPNEKIAVNNKSYDVSLQGYYDRYPVSFMRMILSAEFKLHYSIAKENTSLDFNPSGHFIFTLYRSKFVNFTAVMDLLFSVNKDQTNPFVTIESLVANINVFYNLDFNLMYQYYALGKNTGAGHAFKFELRYAFQ
ncbi:MAG: DUF547 domain-containing protein [Bacteroidia bacterium]